MKIQYASDLHLEFRQNRKFITSFGGSEPSGDILVLAGDIMTFADIDFDFLKWCSINFRDTYWLPGNHEYYGSDLANRSGSFNEKYLSNVYIVNNTSVMVEDVKLVFSTLWTQISPYYSSLVRNGLSDFKAIKNHKRPFTVNDYNFLHNTALSYLKTELDNINGKTVVVTHHCPTYQCINPIYKGKALNEAFHVELFDLIESFGPDYWIYGHNHYNVPDFEIGKTKLITNQCGYVQSGEHKNFNINKFIEI